MDSLDRRIYLKPVLAMTVFAGSFGWLASGIDVGKNADSPPFHIDESHKLAEAFYWHLAFEKRDFSNPAWQEDFYARTNPPVAKYIFGAALALAGYHVHDQQLQTDFERHWRQPRVLRAKVPDGMLRVTRWTSALFGAGICMLVFTIASRVAGKVAGFLAVFMVLLNPYFEYYSRLGLTDSILMFFMTLIVPLTMWTAGIVRRFYASGEAPAGSQAPEAANHTGAGLPRRGFLLKQVRIVLLSSIPPGLIIALAAGTKLNGAMTLGVFALGMTPAFFSGAHRTGTGLFRRSAACLGSVALAAIVAGFLFVMINPYFWQTPAGRLAETLRTYKDWTIKQQVDPGGSLFDIGQRVSAVGHFSLRSDLLPAAQYLGELGTWLVVLGFLIGLAWLARWAIHGYEREEEPSGRSPSEELRSMGTSNPSSSDAGVTLLWILTYGIVTTLWLPLAWRRYLLIPYLPLYVAVAVGLVQLPRVIGLLAGLFEAKTKVARRLIVAGGILALLAAWLVLAMTDWVIAPAKLEPEVISDVPASAQRELYASTLRRDPDNPVILQNHGHALVMWREYKPAIQCLAAAAESLEAKLPLRDVDTIVRYARVSYDLAKARMGQGERARAAIAMSNHVGAIRILRGMMASADPKVREEYDQLISERELWTAQETMTRPVGH